MINSFIGIWNFSKKRQKSFVKSIIFSFIKGMFEMTQMFAIVSIIQVLLGIYPVKTGIKWVVIMMILCIAGTFMTSYVSQISIMETGMFMVADKRISIGNILKNVHLGFFNNSSTGRIGAVLTTTLSNVEATAPMTLINVMGGLLSAVSMLIVMMCYEWHTGVITLVGMVLYIFAVNWQMKISRRDAPIRQEAQNELADATVSFLQGIKVTKAFSFRSGDTRLKSAIEGSRNENINITDKSMFSQVMTQMCVAVFESIIIINALVLYYKMNVISIDILITIIIMSFMIFASMHQAGSILSMIGLLDSAMDDVKELESTKQLECEQPVQTIKSNEIVFNNVCFSYDEGEREILHNVSLKIEPDSLTAIIGPSGSGKSTICQLIPRFWDVSSGSVTIGGADVRHIETTELMSRISMVSQRTYLFEDTILNNIKFGKSDATFEEVQQVAKSARCHDFIMSLPDGYNTVIKEGGNSLSGGEKQRISIARAMLKNAPIIILDEATSALDSENEQAILEAIDELTKNKTVIMIAHRMKTVRNADHIIAVENGRIVQEGTHDELVKQNGIYRRFVKEREDAGSWKIR